MKPITALPASIITSLAIVLGLGFAASVFSTPTVATAGVSESQVVEDAAVSDVEGLEIIITGIRSDNGKIIVAVFDTASPFEAYDYFRATEYGEFEAKQAMQGMAKVSFPNLSDGPYAVSFFHDENGDDDFNMDGDWPLEGYGTSGADDAYDEPTFDEAAVPPGRVIVPMFYLQ